MNRNTLKFELADSFFKTPHSMEDITASMKMWNNINKDSSYMQNIWNVSKGFSYMQNISGITTSAVAAMQSPLKMTMPIDTTQNLLKSVAGIQTILANARLPKTVDLISTIQKILPAIDNTWRMPTIDWEWVTQNIDSVKDFDKSNLDEIITEDVYAELEESVQDAIISGDSQKNIEARYGEWKAKHPLLADIYLLLIPIILTVLFDLIGDFVNGVFSKPSKVYEEPKATSNIVVNVSGEQNVTIVNEVPYYYEILCTDPETGEEKTGYVYKNNIEIVNDEEK